ncbi:MAG: trigger factor [Lachnospiraceae bacterium]|jgi:trigger factor|nr:trigger factor [Lachnospiraceae bacterium]
MSVQVEQTEKNMAKLTVEVDSGELEKALQRAYLKQRNKISIPGFRKGKVPRNLIEKAYGASIFYDDAANDLIPEAYEKAYDESNLEIVSQPKIEVVQIEKDKPFIFTATVATKPEVTLGEYKGVAVDKISTRVTAKDIDEKLNEEAKKNARTVSVDRAVEDGDEIVFDFEGFIDDKAFDGGKGENYTLKIGSKSFIPGFEEQLIGAEKEKEFDVEVTFPDEYHSDELKGKPAVFRCLIHEIKTQELPEIDDEFASEISEFETLEAYKADIKAKLKESKEKEAKAKKEDQAVEAVVKGIKVDIPEPMIETQVSQMAEDFSNRIRQQGLTIEQYFQFTGMTAQSLMDDLRPQAIKRIETRLALEAVAKAENIEVSDEKLDEEITKMAESYKMEVEKLKELLGEKEIERIKKDIAIQEAVEFIVNNAKEK